MARILSVRVHHFFSTVIDDGNGVIYDVKSFLDPGVVDGRL
jgi:hypothetical protein